MQINIQLTGLDDVKRQLAGLAKQVDFAASKALNTTAFKLRSNVNDAMSKTFEGGATAFTLRAFQVEKSSKQNLSATVSLRTDTPVGGNAYDKALRHLFTGGTRDWKKLEGYLRGNALLPAGLMAVPGKGCPLDGRGNIRKSALTEMLGVLKSGLTNLRVYRRTGKGKPQKAVGFFVVKPGDKSKMKPGIYKRIETGSTSGVSPMVMFVRPGKWARFIDFEKIAVDTVNTTFNPEFDRELANAIRTAK